MGGSRAEADPGEALATLTDLSSQIEGAVIVDGKGAVAASSFPSEDAGETLAAAAGELVRAAGDGVGEGRSPLTHLVVDLGDGAVFVVRDGERLIAAVTGPEPTTGLVFYDLKVTLREAKPPPKRRNQAGRSKAKAGSSKGKRDA